VREKCKRFNIHTNLQIICLWVEVVILVVGVLVEVVVVVVDHLEREEEVGALVVRPNNSVVEICLHVRFWFGNAILI